MMMSLEVTHFGSIRGTNRASCTPLKGSKVFDPGQVQRETVKKSQPYDLPALLLTAVTRWPSTLEHFER